MFNYFYKECPICFVGVGQGGESPFQSLHAIITVVPTQKTLILEFKTYILHKLPVLNSPTSFL